MNQKTEQAPQELKPEFTPEFIQALVILTGATLALVFAFERWFFVSERLRHVSFSPFPWIIAAGYTISDGLKLFSGEVPLSMPTSERVVILISLVGTFVVGPTLFFFGWRRRRIDKESGKISPLLNVWTPVFVIGGMLTFSFALPSIPIAYIQRSVSQSLHHAQDIQHNKDNMINEINMIAWGARQHRILPKSLGGGERSFVGYVLPKELVSTQNATYEIVNSEKECAVKASSKLYPGSAVSAKLNEAGRLWGWNYEGLFQ